MSGVAHFFVVVTPWVPYIQQKFKMPNSNAYTNTYLD